MNEPPEKKTRVQRERKSSVEEPQPTPASQPEGGLSSPDAEKETPSLLDEREEDSQQDPVSASSAPTTECKSFVEDPTPASPQEEESQQAPISAAAAPMEESEKEESEKESDEESEEESWHPKKKKRKSKTSKKTNTCRSIVCMDTCCQETESHTPVQPVIGKKETSRTFGNKERYCNREWYETRDWLVLCSTRKRLICHVCRFATSHNLITLSTKFGDDCFSSRGVNNWKKCPRILDKHESTLKHQMSVKKRRSYLTVPSQEQAPLSDAEEEAPPRRRKKHSSSEESEEESEEEGEEESSQPKKKKLKSKMSKKTTQQQVPDPVYTTCGSIVCMDTCCQETEAPAQPFVTKKETARSYGKNKKVERYCDPEWYISRDWLLLCSTRKRLICHVCRFATSHNLITVSKRGEEEFLTTGVNDWKKCPQILDKHEKGSRHQEAVRKSLSYKLQAPIKPVELSAEQSYRRQGIMQLLNCLRFLVRQGITIRGHDDKESNLHQLATLVTRKNEVLENFMATGKYFSHDILNDLLCSMYRVSFNALLTTIRGARHYAIVVDETRDVSGKEQLSFSLRWVSGDYTVHEDFIVICGCPSADVQSIMNTIEDVLCRCGLDIMDMRGQTYDGASVLQGQMSAVATQIKETNPKALSIHCMSHSLYLILQELASKCPMIRGALSLVHDIHEMIASSPERLEIFAKMRVSLACKRERDVGCLKRVCPARWICRVSAVKSLLDNYEDVYYTLDEMINSGVMTEAVKRAPGVRALMAQFEVHLGLKVFLQLFSTAEKVARVLQTKEGTCTETVLSNVNMLTAHYQGMRSDAFFHNIWESANTTLTQAPTAIILPPPSTQQQLSTCRYEDIFSTNALQTPEELYRSRFFMLLDRLTLELEIVRFDQPTLHLLSHIEKLLLAAVNSSDEGPVEIPYDDAIQSCMGDLDMAMLSTQLTMLPSLLTDHNRTSEHVVTSVTKIASLANMLAAAGDAAAERFSEVDKLLRFYLTVPMTNATAERSASSLRLLQNYSPMSEKRLNHLLFLQIHKRLTDELDMSEVLKSFCFGNARRIWYFGQ